MAHRRREFLRPAAWLALLAVLVQALLPAVHHPAGMALAGEFKPSLLHNLCLAPTGSPVDPDKAPAHHLPPCPICQAVHAIGGFAPAPTPIMVPLRVFGANPPALRVAFLIPQRACAFRQPRGPPASI